MMGTTRGVVTAALLAGAVLLAAWLVWPSPSPLTDTGPPAPPGGPIVIVGDRGVSGGFDAYLSEILRTEGWTAFSAIDIAELSAQSLEGRRLAILGWTTRVDAEASSTLNAFVRAGGALVCLGPKPALASLTGISPAGAGTAFVDLPLADDSPGERATAQVFGPTVGLSLGPDTSPVATFVAAPGGQPGESAVSMHRVGAGGVATFGFDPARTVALLRQGDPQWRGEERDGAPGPRASDAFVGWTDLTLAERPQADDHMRLLTSVMASMLAERGGVPRLWYFPAGEPALLVTTADAHGVSVSAVQAGLDLLEQHGGRMSVYYDPPPASGRVRRIARRLWRRLRASSSTTGAGVPTTAQVNDWRTAGHEFAPHPVITNGDLEGSYLRSLEAFRDEGLGGRAASTVRTHAVYWRGWVASAAVEQRAGFGLTLDYYQNGPWLKRSDGSWLHAGFTGSGLPMRLVDENGSVLGIRQLTTTMADEHLIASAYNGWEGLDVDAALAVSGDVLRHAATEHGVPVLQFHLDFLEPGHPLRPTITRWVGQSLERAQAQGIPVWSAARLLEFERCREHTRVVATNWPASDQLRFSVEQPPGVTCATTIDLPWRARPDLSQVVALTVDGIPSPGALVQRGRHQLVALAAGSHAVDLRFGPGPTSSHQ